MKPSGKNTNNHTIFNHKSIQCNIDELYNNYIELQLLHSKYSNSKRNTRDYKVILAILPTILQKNIEGESYLKTIFSPHIKAQ